MELQDKLSYFDQNDIHPYAISYDSVETLTVFAEKHNITYPILSDVNSEVIRAFDIFNHLVPKDHRWYGVPFPGTYMVDAKGIVIDKSFYADYGVRDSVARMLQKTFQIDSRGLPVQTIENDDLKARAYLSSGTMRRGQVQTFTLDIALKNNRHIYAPQVTGGYIPTSLTFDPIKEVRINTVTYPNAIHKKMLGENVAVYEKHIRLTTTVLNRKRENFTLSAQLDYQACDDNECYMPQKLTFELPITYLENV
ncbi:MAG: hypothetical protein ACI8V2_005236 [Candidatus Latescibacterota bacterium]